MSEPVAAREGRGAAQGVARAPAAAGPRATRRWLRRAAAALALCALAAALAWVLAHFEPASGTLLGYALQGLRAAAGR